MTKAETTLSNVNEKKEDTDKSKAQINIENKMPYSKEVCQKLSQIVEDANLVREYPPSRYDVDDTLALELVGVCPDNKVKAQFKVEKFVGGGFAGQVYRVRLASIENENIMNFNALQVGQVYAIKILIPPSGFALFFRNVIYWLAYQGSFSAQTNYAAARAGVLWQKLIRRGAEFYLGSEDSIVDTYATFFDEKLGSFGEVNEWVTGRNWNFEIDDEIFKRKKLQQKKILPNDGSVKSFEYLEKKKFMAKLVDLLHNMGAAELARQYEWFTLKSQPNALKRISDVKNNNGIITAIDFRAGLALLPFLPMSPADVKLILTGLLRGKLVQFDRGDLSKLEKFVNSHAENFADLKPALEELKVRDAQYRESLPDLTHQGFKLIFKSSLRKSVKQGLIGGYKIRGLLDQQHADRLTKSGFKFFLFYLVGLLPVIGKFIRKIWGNQIYKKHIGHILTKRGYFRRTLKAKAAHSLIDWYRQGRVTEKKAFRLTGHLFSLWMQKIFISWLPPKWHRFFTDRKYAWDSFKYTVTYPIRFYRDNDFREAWLLQNVEAGHGEGMLSDEEAQYIRQNIKDPFIQKYLKCVAVHIATLPITQVISVIAAFYAMMRFGTTWSDGLVYAGAVLAAFQATPVSPGSLIRGLYVVYLIIKERDIKDYWIAALISFWHYIGYLGFPIQMVAKFPALSRLMAGRWATGIVRIIPVFGERGALLEHWVFDMFFNVPISIRKKFKKN